MRIERAVTNIKTLGPGNRLGIWVNGCNRRCKGCVSEALQQILFETECVIEDFFEGFNFNKINGVTISGGEPFIQIEELWHLVSFIKSKGINDILIYTGYTLDELKNLNNSLITNILKNIAVLIDGPYIEQLDDQKNNIRGSSNQNIYFFDEKYIDVYQEYIVNQRSMQEFELANILLGVGIPTKEYIDNFKK